MNFKSLIPSDTELLNLVFNAFIKNGIFKTLNGMSWQYFGRKSTSAFLTTLCLEPAVVASVYVTVKREFKFLDKSILAVQSLDTLTDFNYRGKGLFIDCAVSHYHKIKSLGVSFVYGFPNKNSFSGFQNKLDWKSLDPLPFLFLPLNPAFFLSRLPFFKFLSKFYFPFNRRHNFSDSPYKIELINSFNAEFDLLWNKFSVNINLSVIRSSDFLNWRYCQNPDEKYLIYGAYSQDHLIGFIVLNMKRKHGGLIGYVMELIFDPSFDSAGDQLLAHAKNIFLINKVDISLAWCFSHSPNFKPFRKAGFMNLPNIMRPIELHFGYKVLNADNNLISFISDKNSWYLSYSDSDTN